MDLITRPEAEDIKARIPDFDVPQKREYLVWTTFGLNVRQAAAKVGIDHKKPKGWAATDPEFANWYDQCRALSRRGLQKEIVETEFFKNFFRFLRIDDRLLTKYERDPNSLTDHEYAMFKAVRHMYDAAGLTNMIKVTAGRDETGSDHYNVGQINVFVDNQLVRSEEASQVASKSILGLFREDRVIEGESRVIDQSIDERIVDNGDLRAVEDTT